MEADLAGDLSSNLKDVSISLTYPMEVFLAKELYRTVAGLGTDEASLLEILMSQSNDNIAAIKAAYPTSNCPWNLSTYTIYQSINWWLILCNPFKFLDIPWSMISTLILLEHLKSCSYNWQRYNWFIGCIKEIFILFILKGTRDESTTVNSTLVRKDVIAMYNAGRYSA